jgi:hypothetical protein
VWAVESPELGERHWAGCFEWKSGLVNIPEGSLWLLGGEEQSAEVETPVMTPMGQPCEG